MTRRASASESNILGRRQTRWVLARHQKNETRKNHQILIDFSFVSHILYNRINWSEVETCTLKYAWPHIPSSGQTNVQILRNSTFKVELGWYFWWKNSFIMKIQDVAKIWGSGDPRPSPGRKSRRESESDHENLLKSRKIEKSRKTWKTPGNLRIHWFFDLRNKFSLCWRSKSIMCDPGGE